MTDVPAYVRNGRRDILGANRLGHALYSEPYADASDLVANLRTEAGRNPYDRALSDLVGELSMRSEEFRTRWAAHNVRYHNSGLKAIHHPVVGEIHLAFESMDLPAGPGLSLIVYSAGPGSAAEESLKLLASWSATTDGEAAASTAGEAPALPAQVLRAATNRADGATP